MKKKLKSNSPSNAAACSLAPFETAAREYCRITALDPDKPMMPIMGDDGDAVLWREVAREIRVKHAMSEALKCLANEKSDGTAGDGTKKL